MYDPYSELTGKTTLPKSTSLQNLDIPAAEKTGSPLDTDNFKEAIAHKSKIRDAGNDLDESLWISTMDPVLDQVQRQRGVRDQGQLHEKRHSLSPVDVLKQEEQRISDAVPALWGSEHDHGVDTHHDRHGPSSMSFVLPNESAKEDVNGGNPAAFKPEVESSAGSTQGQMVTCPLCRSLVSREYVLRWERVLHESAGHDTRGRSGETAVQKLGCSQNCRHPIGVPVQVNRGAW